MGAQMAAERALTQGKASYAAAIDALALCLPLSLSEVSTFAFSARALSLAIRETLYAL